LQQQGQEQQQQQLLALVMQALQQVPAGEAAALWDLGFSLAWAAAAAGSSAQLAALQTQLVAAVTAAAVKGPGDGGLGAVAGRCLEVTWHAAGAAAARKLWQQLLLLPPAGGDMFRAMVQLEQAAGSSGGSGPQRQLRLAAEAVKRVRAVHEAWAAAYGSSDAGLWVQWALLEQQQNLSGAGKVYWRAVRALEDPEAFIQQYRQKLGAV
jgi:hypothetical protein